MEQIINKIVEAYIKVYGIEKWNSLTNSEKHDAVMTLANSISKALDR